MKDQRTTYEPGSTVCIGFQLYKRWRTELSSLDCCAKSLDEKLQNARHKGTIAESLEKIFDLKCKTFISIFLRYLGTFRGHVHVDICREIFFMSTPACFFSCDCRWHVNIITCRRLPYRLEKVQWKIARTLFFKQFPNAEVRPPYSNRLIDLDLVWSEDAFKIQRLVLGFKLLLRIKMWFACLSDFLKV